jgi:hypothetical protein
LENVSAKAGAAASAKAAASRRRTGFFIVLSPKKDFLWLFPRRRNTPTHGAASNHAVTHRTSGSAATDVLALVCRS